MASLTTAEALHAILQAPTKLRDSMPKDGSFPIIWDSGASISVMNDKADFLTFTKVSPRHNNIMGVAQGLKFSGFGEVLWSILDEKGTLRSFKLPALYIPSATTRLLSTTSLLQSYSGELIQQTGRGMRLSGTSDGQRNAVDATINPNNNLPTSTGYCHSKVMEAANTLINTVSTTAATNTNLGAAEKELLRWHNRLGHISMQKVQFLMRTAVLATSKATQRLHAAASKLTNLPLCSACQFGKQHRRPEPGKTTTVVREHDGALKDRRLLPGQTVSVDHFVCSTKGRLFTSRGHSKDADMYTGGAIYVDMAMNLVHVEFQRHLNTHKTLVATAEFERMCLDAGIIPQEYLSDNGSAFTSKEYMAHLRQFSQISRFAGVGAHHHNGVAERAIQTIMSIAKTMMLHAAIHWPNMTDASLWPMVVQHAVFLHNHVPSPSTGLCPHDLFFKTRWSQAKFHDLHVWGCPVYVLDKTLSDGKKLPRWMPRSHCEVFMGHSSTVPLVLNPATGAITPQYHLVFDDEFTTIGTNEDSLPDLNSDLWATLFGESSFQLVFDDESEELVADLPDEEDPYASALYDHRRSTILTARDTVTPVIPLPVSPPPTTPFPSHPPSTTPNDPPLVVPPPAPPSLSQREIPSQSKRVPIFSPVPTPSPRAAPPVSSTPTFSPSPPPSPPMATSPPLPKVSSPIPPLSLASPASALQREPQAAPPRRSQRAPKPVARLTLDPNKKSYVHTAALGLHYAEAMEQEQFNLNCLHVLKAAASDPDTLTYDEILQDSELEEWKKAATNEIASLEENGTWEEVSIDQAQGTILPGTWVFRRKCAPTGHVIKHKARYCVRGDLQEVLDYAFAPVVAWSTIRMVLVFAVTQDWSLICVDFSNAFVQAKLNSPIWIHLPRRVQVHQRPPNVPPSQEKPVWLSSCPQTVVGNAVQGIPRRRVCPERK